MDLSVEPCPVLSVCLHTAWQKTLSFKELHHGNVNRASACHESGGGKGVNVARVFRQLGMPVGLAGFVGGWSGDCLRGELAATGVMDLTVQSKSRTRCCYTVIDRNSGQATELIEPSGSISPDEFSDLLALISRRMGEFGAMAICGSMQPGIPEDAYGRLAELAAAAGIPVVVDAVKGVDGALECGVRLLKINAAELAQMTQCDTVWQGSETLLSRYPNLTWIAVTNGAEPGALCSRQGRWLVTLPRLEKIVSPIGGGDCATAIMVRRIAEGWNGEIRMPQAFAEALACASASCLTDTPSLFDEQVARKLFEQSEIVRC